MGVLPADWVVLNTGDSVVALHYFLQPASCPPSPSPPVCVYSSHLRQVFGSALHPLSASPSGRLTPPQTRSTVARARASKCMCLQEALPPTCCQWTCIVGTNSWQT